MYKGVHGFTTEPLEIKAIGDIIEIDGSDYKVTELNSYKDDYTDVYNFTYTVEKTEIVLTEEQKIELQKL